jgi:predicted dehydrogenase
MVSICQPNSSIYTDTAFTETEWRKNPTHQGGFLLDGGVHNIAGTRLLLGASAKPIALYAYTTLLQPHLPPVDTVNSIWQTKSGISGTFSMSFGTTFSANEYNVACKKGTVTVLGSKVIVHETGGKPVEKEFSNEGSGVKQEVAAWAESLVAGKANPLQSPLEALADLEIMEKMLTSRAGHGKTESLQFQL